MCGANNTGKEGWTAMRTDKRGAVRRERQGKLLSGEAIAHERNGSERGKLIRANERFVAALDRALLTGGETIEAMQATFRPKKHPNDISAH
jgi:hypothetical protein